MIAIFTASAFDDIMPMFISLKHKMALSEYLYVFQTALLFAFNKQIIFIK